MCGSNIFLSYSTCKTISANVPNLNNLITSCKVLKNFAEYQLAAQGWDLLIYKNNSVCYKYSKTGFHWQEHLGEFLPRKEVPWSPNEHDWEDHHSTPVE